VIERPVIAGFHEREDILFVAGQHGVSAIQSTDRSDASDLRSRHSFFKRCLNINFLLTRSMLLIACS
jgi:hypothetical protein